MLTEKEENVMKGIVTDTTTCIKDAHERLFKLITKGEPEREKTLDGQIESKILEVLEKLVDIDNNVIRLLLQCPDVKTWEACYPLIGNITGIICREMKDFSEKLPVQLYAYKDEKLCSMCDTFIDWMRNLNKDLQRVINVMSYTNTINYRNKEKFWDNPTVNNGILINGYINT